MTKDEARRARNSELTKQLSIAMDLNPGLTMIETLNHVVHDFAKYLPRRVEGNYTFKDVPPAYTLLDSELLDILMRYNTRKIADTVRHHVEGLVSV